MLGIMCPPFVMEINAAQDFILFPPFRCGPVNPRWMRRSGRFQSYFV